MAQKQHNIEACVPYPAANGDMSARKRFCFLILSLFAGTVFRINASLSPKFIMGTSKNVKFPLAYHTPRKIKDFAKKCMNLS